MERKLFLAGWILSIILCGFLSFSASGKFLMPPDMATMLSHLGYTPESMFPLGIVELLSCALFLIPRTSFIGAILLTGYLGGATATHYRVADPFFVPIVIGIFVWIAYGLRNQAVLKKALTIS